MSPAYTAFSFCCCPHPPAPFPAGRGRSRLFYARGFAPCIPGAEPGRHWLVGRQRYPAGLVRWSPDDHALTFFFFPHPPPRVRRALFPAGRGRPKLFYARGFAPCIPGDEPKRHWLSLPYRYPCGGLVRLVACSTCHCGTKRECLPSLSPVYTAFSFGCCPHPPAPFPSGEGGDQGYFYARGFAPCIPGIRPLAALTVPAKPALRREAYPGDSTDSVRASGRVFPRK